MAENEKEKPERDEPPTSPVETGDERESSSLVAPPGVEPDEPPSKAIVAVLAALSVFVVMAAVGLWQLFGLTSIAEIEIKDLQVENQDLLELRARDWGRLTQYESLDGGTYQIPIERAMEKLVRDPSLIAPLVVPSVADAGAPDATDDATADASDDVTDIDAEGDAPATQRDGEASKETKAPVASAAAPPATVPSPVSSETHP